MRFEISQRAKYPAVPLPTFTKICMVDKSLTSDLSCPRGLQDTPSRLSFSAVPLLVIEPCNFSRPIGKAEGLLQDCKRP